MEVGSTGTSLQRPQGDLYRMLNRAGNPAGMQALLYHSPMSKNIDDRRPAALLSRAKGWKRYRDLMAPPMAAQPSASSIEEVSIQRYRISGGDDALGI